MPKPSWQTYQTARRLRVRLGVAVGAIEPAEAMALRRATLALIGGLPDHRLAVQGHEALGYLQAHAGLLGIAEAAGELDADDLSARERTAAIRALLAASCAAGWGGGRSGRAGDERHPGGVGRDTPAPGTAARGL